MANKKQPTIEDRVKAGYIDLTKTGPLSYNEIRRLNNTLPEDAEDIVLPGMGRVLSRAGKVNYTATPTGLGDSSYDPGIANENEIGQLQNIRAEAQPWYVQLGAGLAKGVALAGTTFLDGTIGLITGIGQGISNLADGDSNTGFWQGLWNNDVSLGLREFNNWMEEALPNYYRDDYADSSIWNKLGTMNFWADGLLKNMGFMVGAVYSGGVLTKSLKAFGALKSNLGARVVGSLFSGVNEGRIEATNLYKDTLDLSMAQIEDQYNRRRQEIINSGLSDEEKNTQLNQLERTTTALQKDAEIRANSAAGVDLLANSILLPLDDFFTYGKIYGQGFKNVKNLGEKNVKRSIRQKSKDAVKDAEKHLANDLEENVTKEGSEYLWDKITNKQSLRKGLWTGLREGNEEMLQQFFSSTAGNMYQPESPDAYYKAMINNRTQVEAQDTMTALAKGFADSYGDGSQYEQFVVGALTGLIGSPTFGKGQNSSANTYLGRGKSIGLSGGIFGEFSTARDLNRRGQEAVDAINKARKKVSDGKVNLAMAIGFNNDMEGYAQENNKFEYENAADNDLFRLFSRLVSVGREGDFMDMVDQDFDNISDEDLEKIAGYTAKTPDTLNYSDGFRNEDGTLMPSTKEGRAKMREKLKERKEHLIKQMNSYKDSLGTVRGMTNNSLSPDQEDELAWLLWKSKRFGERAKEVKERYGEGLNSIIEAINIRKNELESTINAKLKKQEILGRAAQNALSESVESDISDIEDAQGKTSSELKDLQKELNNYNILSSIVEGIKEGEINSGWIASNMEATDSEGNKTSLAPMLLSEDFYKQFVRTGKDYTQYRDGLTAVLDTVKLLKARDMFNEKLAEYMSKPEKLAENRAKIDKQEANKTADVNHLKGKDKVASSSVAEMSNLEDDELSELEDLLNEDSDSEELAKVSKAKEVKAAKESIRQKINEAATNGTISLEEAQDAISLLDANGVDANSLEELEDMDSEAILSAAVDTSELEAILQQAVEEGNGSEAEALETLNKERERRKDAARTVLGESIRLVQEERKKARSMP